MWKDRLLTQLGVLQQQSILELWHDRRIGAGADWYQDICKAMDAAHIAVLLISAHLSDLVIYFARRSLASLNQAAAGRPPHRANPRHALPLEASALACPYAAPSY
jgi:hypothetical protein